MTKAVVTDTVTLKRSAEKKREADVSLGAGGQRSDVPSPSNPFSGSE